MPEESDVRSAPSRGIEHAAGMDPGAPMEPCTGANFCPDHGVNAGAAAALQQQETGLLRRRLAAAAAFLVFVCPLAALRALWLANVAALAPLATTVAAALCWWVLRRGRPRSCAGLRALEAAMFAAALLTIAAEHALIGALHLRAGEIAEYANLAARVPAAYVLLMLTYGILVPATWRRAALFAGASLLTVSAVEVGLWQRFAAAASPGAWSAERFSYGLLIVGIGAALAVYGTHTLSRYRRELAEARTAGMYRLVRRIALGGMGEVWLAEHRSLARPVAIKMVRPELLRTGDAARRRAAIERFGREARAMASLESPHTAQVFDFGVATDGTFFYVMEYLRGTDLDRIVKHFGPLPPARAIHLLLQAGEALQEAHDAGLVHRDVKPANLHVGRLGNRYDWLKVLDFGLVRSLREEAERDPRLTQDGITTGTPAFMPPEMAQGPAQADARSDVYALAAVAYWLVTGQLVFEGVGPMDMVVKHVKEEPLPPSRRVEFELPEALDRAILAGLRKRPGDRPQSVREFCDMLRGVRVGEPWTQERAADWWQTHFPEAAAGVA